MASTGIGERLRSARQALGLSLEEIENVTHIRRSYLEALEREAFELLPGPAYTRGFLRAYAACLGLPPEDVLDRYPSTTPGSVPQRESPVEVRITPALRMSPVRRAVIGVGLLAALGVVFVGIVLYIQVREFAQTAPQGSSGGGAPLPSPTTPTTKPPAPATRPAPARPAPPRATSPAATPPPVRPAAPPTATPPPRPAAQPPATPPPATSPSAPASPPATGPAAAPRSTPQPAPSASQPVPLNVAIAAAGHTWIRAVADGTTVYEGFLNAGDKQTWQAKRSLTLRVGNAGAVTLSVNGKPLGSLGGPGQVYEHTFSSATPAP